MEYEGPSHSEVVIVKCFAFNQNGMRCMQQAGHDGNHAIVSEWTDEESWTPDRGTGGVTTATITGPVVEHLVSIPAPSGKCVICDHKMHDGMCTGMDGEFPCDCANGVEA